MPDSESNKPIRQEDSWDYATSTDENEPTKLIDEFDLSNPSHLINDPTRITGNALNEDDASVETGWLRRNLLKISGGLFLGGIAVSAAVNPIGALEHDVINAAPWAIAGIGLSESMWIGGAALMAVSAGKKIGNPFKLRERWAEISQSVIDSKTFRTGLAVNTIGAIGTAAVLEVGTITSLPPETWLGSTGLATADLASTVAIRSGVYVGLKDRESKSLEKSEKPKPKIREAVISDIDRLADIDLLLFDKAYGTEKPKKEEVVEMLTKRLTNNPGWMLVAEVNGEIEGFVTAFRTNTPIENFKSWEDSTANGTLDGKIVDDGKYGYVANMTVKHEAVELGAEDMMLATMFAKGIRGGVDYVYFVSRMPHFKRWTESQGIDLTDSNKQLAAEQYLKLRNDDGKRHDPQLRMYENFGFQLNRMVANAFEDDASLNYGVVFKVSVPPSEMIKKIKPARLIIAKILTMAAKNPTVLARISRFK